MKLTSFVLLAGTASLFLAQGASSTLQTHIKTLQDAGSMTATLAAQQIGGAPETFKISYSKPNLLKIETPSGWTLSDGKTVYSYNKKENTWTEEPLTEESLKSAAGAKEAWAWLAFFDKGAFKAVTASKAGANRVIKGTATNELSLTMENGSGVLYIDPKLGMARGFTYKSGETDLLVTSTDIQVGKEPLPADQYAFSAPAGSKKVEAPKADEASYVRVQALLNRSCLPCHGAQQRSGGYELTTYQGIMQAVAPGAPADSKLIQVISGPNPTMPKMRPPMKESDVELISKWIEAGAKKS